MAEHPQKHTPRKHPQKSSLPAPAVPRLRPLTIRQRKFIAAKIAGKKNAESYVEAGYKATTRRVADVEASKLLHTPRIQDEINKALEFHGATPEFAVGRLKKIAEQDNELGASRLAAKDILELHGWRKDERPGVTLSIKQAFFVESRANRVRANESADADIIDGAA